MSKDENPSAFPRPDATDAMGCGIREGSDGMTLRDWFAGGIAAGMAAYSGTEGACFGPGDIATRAFEIADAMLAERAKP